MGKRILIVDDDAMSRKITGITLKKQQYEIDTAESGAECIERLQKESFDLLLLDVEMPEQNGFETLREIRAQKLAEGMHVLFLTGNEEDEIQHAIVELHADGFIKKPFLPQELMETVQKTL